MEEWQLVQGDTAFGGAPNTRDAILPRQALCVAESTWM